MCNWVVVEVIVDQPPDNRRIWRFDVTKMKYQQGVSLDWFFNSGRCRKSDNIIYRWMPEADFLLYSEEYRAALGKAVDMTDVWALYQVIGYDRKKKRYV
jgi:hypothetical protein